MFIHLFYLNLKDQAAPSKRQDIKLTPVFDWGQ